MRTTIVIFLTLFSACLVASAQVPSANVFFGYSYYSSDLTGTGRSNLNGFEASVEGKLIPFLGFVADFDGHYGNQNFFNPSNTCGAGVVCGTIGISTHQNNYLFGPRVSVSVGRFRPFAQALFGVAHVSTNGFGSDTSFATAVGGGLDFRIIRPLAWRFQGDYVHTSVFSVTQNNVRISTGIVLRF